MNLYGLIVKDTENYAINYETLYQQKNCLFQTLN